MNWPRLRYPRSFTGLLLLGFTLVALPLLGGMLNMGYMLDRMAREGRQSMQVTVQATRSTHQLAEAVLALQRAAGQYLVLEDPALASALLAPHRDFQAAVVALRALPLDARQQARLTGIEALEQGLFSGLSGELRPGPQQFEALEPEFDRLHQAAAEMAVEGNRLIDGEVAALGHTADAIRQTLIWQALAILPLSLFMAGLFSRLIAQPLTQLAGAIRKLGEHDLGAGPPIDGPRDLVFLGEQVDWLRRRLLELEEQQLRFLRQVSHELKTPLTALKEGVELLADGVAGELGAQQAEIAGIMRSNVRDLQHRIEDLLSYSRLAQRATSLTAVDLAVMDLLAAVYRRQKLPLRAKKLKLRADVGDVRVLGDKDGLETVFDNLLANAIRFSPEAGAIVVKARRLGGRCEIVICDAGPGVAPEDRSKLFLPFYRGRIQRQGAVRGSGLGLAIVKEYIEAQGGEVSLLEDHAGGTCFRILLASPEEAHDAA